MLTKGGSNDELHIVVIDEDGEITGTKGDVLETFEAVSKKQTLKTPRKCKLLSRCNI